MQFLLPCQSCVKQAFIPYNTFTYFQFICPHPQSSVFTVIYFYCFFCWQELSKLGTLLDVLSKQINNQMEINRTERGCHILFIIADCLVNRAPFRWIVLIYSGAYALCSHNKNERNVSISLDHSTILQMSNTFSNYSPRFIFYMEEIPLNTIRTNSGYTIELSVSFSFLKFRDEMKELWSLTQLFFVCLFCFSFIKLMSSFLSVFSDKIS